MIPEAVVAHALVHGGGVLLQLGGVEEAEHVQAVGWEDDDGVQLGFSEKSGSGECIGVSELEESTV